MTASTMALTANLAYQQTERQRWAACYEAQLQRQLAWAIHYVQSGEHPPAEIIRHLNSFLALLHQARRYPALRADALALVSALHPWPAKWGYRDIWQAEMRFAIQTAEQLAQFDLQAKFQSYLANLVFQIGNYQQAADAARQAAVIARQHNDLEALLSAFETIIDAYRALGLAEQAEEALRELETIARDIETQVDIPAWKKAVIAAKTLWIKAPSSSEKEHTARALTAMHHAIAALEAAPHDDLATRANLYNLSGIIHWRRDEYTASIQNLQKAHALYTQDGDIFAQASLLGNLGTVYWSMGRFAAAEEVLRQCVNTTEELNTHWRLLKAIRMLAVVYLARGQLQTALHYNTRHLELALELGERREAAGATAIRGHIQFHLGNYEAARADLETCLAMEGDATSIDIGNAYVNLSRSYAALGQQAHALELLHKAEALAELNNSIRLHIVALRCLANYQTPAESRATLQQALALAQQHGRLLDQAACLLALAHRTDAIAEKNALWEQGVDLLKQMGAETWLQGHAIERPPQLPMSV